MNTGCETDAFPRLDTLSLPCQDTMPGQGRQALHALATTPVIPFRDTALARHGVYSLDNAMASRCVSKAVVQTEVQGEYQSHAPHIHTCKENLPWHSIPMPTATMPCTSLTMLWRCSQRITARYARSSSNMRAEPIKFEAELATSETHKWVALDAP